MRQFGPALGGFCTVCAALSATTAFAQDGGLRMVFGLENRLEISRNSDLSVPATGTDITDETRLSFGLFSVREIDRLEFTTSGVLIAENLADGGTNVDFGRGAANLAYHREVPAAAFDLGAFYRRDDVDAFDDGIGDDDETGTRTDYGANIGLEIGRTSPIGFDVGAAYEVTEYQDASDPTLFDTTETRADAAITFHPSEIATGRLGLRYRLTDEDDPAGTTTESLTTFAGLDYSITERLDLSAEVGYVQTDTEVLGVTDRTTGPDLRFGLTYEMPVGTASALLRVTTDEDEGQRETLEFGRDLETPLTTLSARLGITHADAAGTDLIGRLALARNLPDGSISLTLERSVSFDDELEVNSSAGVSWTRNINEISSVSLDLTYEHSDAPSERIEQVTFGAAYSRNLTADWNFNSGVGYEVRNDGDGHAESPTLFVSLSREFEIRP